MSVTIEGQHLSMEPQNIGLTDLARRCKKGRPSYVILMPGDGTRYEFYILPFKNPHLKMVGTTEDFALIAVVGKGAYPLALWSDHHPDYIAHKLGVDNWTARVVKEFLACLWYEMNDLDEVLDIEE